MEFLELESLRIDKWLHAARFYKTRGICQDMINGGKVECNGQRAKVSKQIVKGDKIRLLQGQIRKEVIVVKIYDKRGPASVAATMYEETADSIEKREKAQELMKNNAFFSPASDSKPNKKQRRQLLEIKHNYT